MIQVGTKGMYAGVIGLFDDAAQPLRYQRIPLDATISRLRRDAAVVGCLPGPA